jgi:hypothetical protein
LRDEQHQVAVASMIGRQIQSCRKTGTLERTDRDAAFAFGTEVILTALEIRATTQAPLF